MSLRGFIRVATGRRDSCEFASCAAVRAVRLFSLLCMMWLLTTANAFAADAKKPAAEKDKGAAAADPAAQEAAAQAAYGSVCQAEIHYYWRQLGAQHTASKAIPASTAPVAAAKPVESKAILAYYTTISEQAKIEEDAKARIAARLSAARGAALDSCKEEHESASGCIERRLSRVSRTYSNIDYASRRIVMSSVISDCHATLGVCLTAEVSPVKCWTESPPEAQIPFTQPREAVIDTVPDGIATPGGTAMPEAASSAGVPKIVKPGESASPKSTPAGKPRPPKKPGAPADPGFDDKPPGENQPDNPFSKPFSL